MSDPVDPPPRIVTRLTAPGRGAVATLRVEAPTGVLETAGFRAADEGRLSDKPVDRIVYGRWRDEDVVVCRTSESTTEIHCHGGSAAVARIEADLLEAGCEVVSWPDMAERRSTFERELLETVTRATTVRTASLALAQRNGVLQDEIVRLTRLMDTGELVDGLGALLVSATTGLHLVKPWRVVLTGRPNVGKSSLVNALLGFGRAIVFDEPGTTRDVVTGTTAFDGWPVTLADTAGLREADEALEARGVERARDHLRRADLPIVVVDTSTALTPEDEAILAEWPTAIVVAHKCDLPCIWGPTGAIRVSSLDGTGIDELIAAIVARLVPLPPTPRTPLLVTERQRSSVADARARAVAGDRVGAIRTLLAAFDVKESDG